MADEPKNIRLKNIAKEFNVGIQNLVDCLVKKGHQIDMNPNIKVTPEQYDILAKAFQSERKVKENADKIKLSNTGSVVVEVAKNPTTETVAEEEQPREVFIKDHTFTTAKTAEPESVAEPEMPAEPDSDPEPTAEAQPEEQPTETATKEESGEKPDAESETVETAIENEPDIEIVPEEKTEPESVTETESETAVPATEEPNTHYRDVNIVGHIDLDSINTRTRPQKKTKAQRAAEKQQQQNAPAEKPAEQIPPTTNESAIQKNEPEHIETQYQKLNGPKLVGKIDPEQLEKSKSKPTHGEKKKRKRIQKESVKINDVISDNNKKEEHSKPQKDKKKEKKAKVEKKTVIDDNEIEKQIRDTLARLNPLGKSKTSKHNREKRQKVHQRIEEEQLSVMESSKTLQVTEFVTANELATMMSTPVNKIIATCMSVGIFVSINQRLDAETIKLIADEFGFEINFASADVVDSLNKTEEEDRPEDLVPRNPIITVMGHVDHGKTSLLDYIRKTNVIAGEAGGITQHIGAYEVTTADGRKITFLDTPGHEAFTAMRARGAKVTDIAIIIISADDKIMPQTVEAINHAQAAGVPIVFAINKIDKPGADPDRIKTELAQMNLLVEEWGGKYQSQDISAKKGINVEELLEKVILQADIMELKGNPNKRAKGTVLESSLDKGRGYIAKILVEDGTIRKGDPIVAGTVSGRVRAMYNERNQEVMSAGPSQPVLLLGLNGACQAGDTFNIMESEKEAKDIANKRTQLQREQGIRTQTHMTLDEIGRRIALGNFKELNLIVKGDVDGTVEALADSLLKLSTEEVQVNVIHKAVGQITESDVQLAGLSDAIIIGFQVRPSVQARKIAETEHIDIRLYSIIYDAINELKDAIEGMLAPETQEKIVANLEIRETFRISKVGTIAGCMCLDGKINRHHNIRIIRDGIVVHTGRLASLKRFKDDVKEVVSGQDCGLNIEAFNDIQVGDIVEAYEVIEIKRKL